MHFARGKTLIKRENFSNQKYLLGIDFFYDLRGFFSRHTQSHHFHTEGACMILGDFSHTDDLDVGKRKKFKLQHNM